MHSFILSTNTYSIFTLCSIALLKRFNGLPLSLRSKLLGFIFEVSNNVIPTLSILCLPVQSVELWNTAKLPFHEYISGLPWWLRGKESACSTGAAGDMGSIPGPERSSRGGHGSPLQYSCMGDPMDRGAWRAIVHRVTKSRTQLKQLSMHTHTNTFH